MALGPLRAPAEGTDKPARACVLRAGASVARLVVGKHREGSRLELGAMIVQLAIILQLVLLPLFVVFSLGFRERAYISFLVWSGGFGIAFIFRVVYVLWQVLGHRSGTRN